MNKTCQVTIDIGSSGYIIAIKRGDADVACYSLERETDQLKIPNVVYVEAFGHVGAKRIPPCDIYFSDPTVQDSSRKCSGALGFFMNWKNYFFNSDATINFDRDEPTIPSKNFQSLRIALSSIYIAFFYRLMNYINKYESEQGNPI